jgi:hypothetical protein
MLATNARTVELSIVGSPDDLDGPVAPGAGRCRRGAKDRGLSSRKDFEVLSWPLSASRSLSPA